MTEAEKRENQKIMILFVAALYVIVALTFTAMWAYQAKVQATDANTNAQTADKDAQAADNDAQQTDTDVNNVCSAINNLPDGSC